MTPGRMGQKGSFWTSGGTVHGVPQVITEYVCFYRDDLKWSSLWDFEKIWIIFREFCVIVKSLKYWWRCEGCLIASGPFRSFGVSAHHGVPSARPGFPWWWGWGGLRDVAAVWEWRAGRQHGRVRPLFLTSRQVGFLPPKRTICKCLWVWRVMTAASF